MRFLAELSGENVDFSLYELSRVLESEGIDFSIDRLDGRLLHFHCDHPDGMGAALPRLGLCHRVFRIIVGKTDLENIREHVPEGREIKSFGIATRRYGEKTGGQRDRIDSLKWDMGAALSRSGLTVDLSSPDLWIYLISLNVSEGAAPDGDILAAERIWERDRKEFASRAVENRPFSTPVSLHPKLARAMINCTGLSPGPGKDRLPPARGQAGADRSPRSPPVIADPFCGTGGILLEAGCMGFVTVGLDLDPRMIEGCRVNLEHFGITGCDLGVSDIAGLHTAVRDMGVEKVDAVVSDFPYGRASTTFKEPPIDLYDRAFLSISQVLRGGGRAVVALPSREAADEIGGKHLELLKVFENYVHRSLTRYFCIYKRR